MVTFTKAVFLALGLSAGGHALEAVILADTNRDGQVTGADNLPEKSKWDDKADVGAIFLANIADSNGECSKRILAEKTKDDKIADCNDASGTTLHNAKFLAPLRVPGNKEVPNGAKGSITLSGPLSPNNKDWSEKKVRIFRKRENSWEYVFTNADAPDGHQPTRFDITDLQNGLDLGIDARDVRRKDQWDGRITVTFSIHDANDKLLAEDKVQLRVAPVLTQHVRQDIDKVFTVSGKENNWTEDIKAAQAKFAQNIIDFTNEAGVPHGTGLFDGEDVFIQDWFEAGYTSMPGPDGPVVLRVNIRSCRTEQPEDRMVFTHMRSENVGAVQCSLPSDQALQAMGEQGVFERNLAEAMGNLETIPPHTGPDGTEYPAGRAIIGRNGQEVPDIGRFMEAQGVQDPIYVDISWLNVGHVDEIIQFLPFNNERGWKMVVADPKAGYAHLVYLAQNKLGGLPAMSRDAEIGDPHTYDPDEVRSTVFEVLRLPDIQNAYEQAEVAMKNNIDEIKAKTGINDNDIISVPVLFYKEGGDDANHFKIKRALDSILNMNTTEIAMGDRRLLRRTGHENNLISLYGNPVNGIVYSNGKYLSPSPWGPKVKTASAPEASDFIAATVSKAFKEKAGFDVTYRDTWFTHHVHDGEIHCGTNVYRALTNVAWWPSKK